VPDKGHLIRAFQITPNCPFVASTGEEVGGIGGKAAGVHSALVVLIGLG